MWKNQHYSFYCDSSSVTMDELCKAEAVCVSELASYLVASVKFLSFKCKVRLSQGLSLSKVHFCSLVFKSSEKGEPCNKLPLYGTRKCRTLWGRAWASWYRNIVSLMSDVTHQVKHPPTCTIHSPFTRKNKKWGVFCFVFFLKMCANIN